MKNVRYICPSLTKFCIFYADINKSTPNTKFNENPSSGNRANTRGQTDGQTGEMTK